MFHKLNSKIVAIKSVALRSDLLFQLSTVFWMLLIFSCQSSIAQNDFYDTEVIQEIRIYFEEENWDEILDQYYVDGQKQRLLGSVNINGELLDSVGIRYKGFSSVSVDRIKNPFNIKLDYVIEGQKYEGIDKIKLSNVIQDPSFLREVLSYEIVRKYMPASQANFSNVYVNDELLGLYTNVEAVNGDFLSDNFDSNNNAFFKCNPRELDFDGGNSNLDFLSSTDTLEYLDFYDMRSEKGWQQLLEMIDVLNNDSENMEDLLHVDQTLWMHAFNYSLINFDSYVGYAQNYYLYVDDLGRFNPIVWDLNMSFASFRFTDDSEFFEGFSIEEAKTIDPLTHFNTISIYPRPLMRQLFEDETYRKMYLAHIRTIVEENFLNDSYLQRSEELRMIIDVAVAEDENAFYGYANFVDNLYLDVSDLIDYPGLVNLMEDRTEYLMNYEGISGSPTILSHDHSPEEVVVGNDITLTVSTENAGLAFVYYRFSESEWFTKAAMMDDGNSGDGAAGDGVYGYTIPDVGNNIQYYFWAENETAGRFSPERAARDFHVLFAPVSPGDVVINEFMATNIDTQADEAGEFNDWIELFNNGSSSLSLSGMYLSDNPDNLDKWACPNVEIEAGGYVLVWADENSGQGNLHANFQLSSLGESLYLSYADGTILDSVQYGMQSPGKSTGRLPNGIGDFEELFPTFASNNDAMTGIEELKSNPGWNVFPNPADDLIFINAVSNENASLNNKAEIQLFTIDGLKLPITKRSSLEGLVLDVSQYSSGCYYLKIQVEEQVQTTKIIIK